MTQEEKIKCLIIDLDETLWEGVLSEGGAHTLRPGMRELLNTLDSRGILLSIASKNEYTAAMARLRDFELDSYFLCPQIGWGKKSQSVLQIISDLGIKAENVAFLDDSPFERDEVAFSVPHVRVFDAAQVNLLADMSAFIPTFITEDAQNRRAMYRADFARRTDEKAWSGSEESFLQTLNMHLNIQPVTEQDLRRVYELTVRTHQLNSTGYTYDYDELVRLVQSPTHIFLIASLTDRYGDSGKVGLLLLEKTDALRIKLLIVSCRVMSRGIGTALLTKAIRLAADLHMPLFADFMETEHNRIMYITYKLAGFHETDVAATGPALLLRYEGNDCVPYAPYLTVTGG